STSRVDRVVSILVAALIWSSGFLTLAHPHQRTCKDATNFNLFHPLDKKRIAPMRPPLPQIRHTPCCRPSESPSRSLAFPPLSFDSAASHLECSRPCSPHRSRRRRALHCRQ